MMKIKKNLKYVLNIFFIVVIGWLTVRLLFRGEEFSDIVADLHLAKKSWLAVGAVCVLLCGRGVGHNKVYAEAF